MFKWNIKVKYYLHKSRAKNWCSDIGVQTLLGKSYNWAASNNKEQHNSC